MDESISDVFGFLLFLIVMFGSSVIPHVIHAWNVSRRKARRPLKRPTEDTETTQF